METFHIATTEGPIAVQGVPFVTTIGEREARLFIHTESELEGARLSCQRSGMMVAKLAPYLLMRFIQTGDIEAARNLEAGAHDVLYGLLAKHGADRLWKVMDKAPDLKIEQTAQQPNKES